MHDNATSMPKLHRRIVAAAAITLCAQGFAASAQTQVAALDGAAATAPAAAAAATDGVQVQQGVTTSSLEILVNGAVALKSDTQFSELSIANPEIADISTLTDRSIYVLGKNPGRTTLMLFGDNGQVMSMVHITVAPDITEFKERLVMILPDENIQAFTANDGIVMAGTITSQTHMDQALELANRYAPGRISNLMVLEARETLGIDIGALRADLRAALPDGAIDAQLDGDRIVLTGAVTQTTHLNIAIEMARLYAPGQVNNLMTVEVPYVAPNAEELSAKFLEILPGEAISVHTVSQSVILSGSVSSPERMTQAVQLAQLFAPQSEISNLLSVVASKTCFIRTRRGAEVIATAIPCHE